MEPIGTDTLHQLKSRAAQSEDAAGGGSNVRVPQLLTIQPQRVGKHIGFPLAPPLRHSKAPWCISPTVQQGCSFSKSPWPDLHQVPGCGDSTAKRFPAELHQCIQRQTRSCSPPQQEGQWDGGAVTRLTDTGESEQTATRIHRREVGSGEVHITLQGQM